MNQILLKADAWLNVFISRETGLSFTLKLYLCSGTAVKKYPHKLRNYWRFLRSFQSDENDLWN